MAVIAVIHDSPTPTSSDQAIHDFLEARGHTVDLVVENASTAVSSSTYAAVVISESGSSTAVNPYVDWPNGVLCFETVWNTLGIASAAASSGTTSTDIDLTGSHEINSGFADPLTIFGTGQNVWGCTTAQIVGGAEAIALQPGTATRALAVVAEAGVTDPSAGRRAAMGLIAARPEALNTAGQDYVTAIVDWLVAAGGISVNLGLATQPSTALAVARRKAKTAGLPTQADIGQAMVRRKSRLVRRARRS